MNANLLSHRWLRQLLASRWYPGILQAITITVFVGIIWQLVAGPTAAYMNFGTALTWILWWPLLPIGFVLLGRFWCAICPFGTLNDLVQKFVGNNRPVPAFLKKYGIWIIDALFILITWFDHVGGIVGSPWGSGLLLLLLTTGVIISGAFMQRRAWCRYLCFLGGLSGNYSRSGILALRANQKICSTCQAKAACYNGSEKGPGCPMFEFPRQMTSNASCTLCAKCIKTCPNDAIELTLRPPTQELWFIAKPKFEEAFLAVVIMGIVFVQNITMLEIWNGILKELGQYTGTDNYLVNFTITFLIAMAIPVGLLFLTTAMARRFNGDSLTQNFARFGYAIIPLDIAGHIGHNVFHFLGEGGSIAYTGMALLGNPIPLTSTALVSTPIIQVIQYLILGLGALGSLYAVYAIAKNQYGKARVWQSFACYAVLIAIFYWVNLLLFSFPMGSRM